MQVYRRTRVEWQDWTGGWWWVGAGALRHRDDAMIVMEYAGERNLLSVINDRRHALPYCRRVRSVT